MYVFTQWILEKIYELFEYTLLKGLFKKISFLSSVQTFAVSVQNMLQGLSLVRINSNSKERTHLIAILSKSVILE